MSEEKKTTLSINKSTLSLKGGFNKSSDGKKVVQVEVRKKRVIGGNPINNQSSSNPIDDATAAKLKLIAEAKEFEEKKRKEEELRQKEREQEQALREVKKHATSETTEEEPVEKKTEQRPAVKKEEKVFNDAPKPKEPKKEEKDKFEAKKVEKRSFEPQRRNKNFNVNSINDDDDGYDTGTSNYRKRYKKKQPKPVMQQTPQEKVIKDVTIPEVITVQELANRMAEKSADVIKKLMSLGVMATINQPIDADTAQIVVEEFGHKFKRVADSDVELGIEIAQDKEGDLLPRPPVVTVMGHVDHGKTSLLDALRETNVVAREAGGITQHIGAYQIEVEGNRKITFIDTPGHEAFSQMRARGAKVTDIVVLVVAANDGIMPQTIEAIRHAQAAEVPIVVAINKIDLPGADPMRVKTDLLQHGIAIEEMGGESLCAEVSAKKRININGLVDAICLQAEMLDLKANPNRMAEGTVVEAKMEKGRGSVATVLVQKGTLKIGDIIIAGKEWGRVRAMFNSTASKVLEALPARPVEILGLQGTPSAGDDFIVVADENKAKEVTSYRIRKEKEAKIVKSAKSAMEQMLDKIKTGEIKNLPIIIKADVQGSIEALEGTLKKMANDEVGVQILHSAVGGISESDVSLAKASHAFIIGFNVRATPQARELAKREDVDIKYYSIIYNVADDVKKALEGMLSPEEKEKIIGYAQIRKVFNITGVGKVAGCMVTEGFVKRGAKVRLLRDNVVIHDGELGQLKRAKDDVKEVKDGYECGMSFANYNDIQENDFIECYEIESTARTL
ncbi:MAG: translation initiation factor IF-2 [Alphaproteobacteria bacterium]